MIVVIVMFTNLANELAPHPVLDFLDIVIGCIQSKKKKKNIPYVSPTEAAHPASPAWSGMYMMYCGGSTIWNQRAMDFLSGFSIHGFLITYIHNKDPKWKSS